MTIGRFEIHAYNGSVFAMDDRSSQTCLVRLAALRRALALPVLGSGSDVWRALVYVIEMIKPDAIAHCFVFTFAFVSYSCAVLPAVLTALGTRECGFEQRALINRNRKEAKRAELFTIIAAFFHHFTTADAGPHIMS